jgi:hypothetical protein
MIERSRYRGFAGRGGQEGWDVEECRCPAVREDASHEGGQDKDAGNGSRQWGVRRQEIHI